MQGRTDALLKRKTQLQTEQIIQYKRSSSINSEPQTLSWREAGLGGSVRSTTVNDARQEQSPRLIQEIYSGGERQWSLVRSYKWRDSPRIGKGSCLRCQPALLTRTKQAIFRGACPLSLKMRRRLWANKQLCAALCWSRKLNEHGTGIVAFHHGLLQQIEIAASALIGRILFALVLVSLLHRHSSLLSIRIP